MFKTARRSEAYPHRTRTTKLPLQAVDVFLGNSLHVGICQVYEANCREKNGRRGREHHGTLAGGRPVVLVRGEDAQQIVILVDGFAEVPPLLGIPPVAIGVTELPLDRGRVDVAAILARVELPFCQQPYAHLTCIQAPGQKNAPLTGVTNHSRILGIGQLRVVGIFFVDNLP